MSDCQPVVTFQRSVLLYESASGTSAYFPFATPLCVEGFDFHFVSVNKLRETNVYFCQESHELAPLAYIRSVDVVSPHLQSEEKLTPPILPQTPKAGYNVRASAHASRKISI